MDELDEIDRVLHSLRTNWTTYGVWADWFDERGLEDIGYTLRQLGGMHPMTDGVFTDADRGMYLFDHVVRDHAHQFARFGDAVAMFYSLYPKTFRHFSRTSSLRTTASDLRNIDGEVRHVGRFAPLAAHDMMAHCDCRTRGRIELFEYVRDDTFLRDQSAFLIVPLRAIKVREEWYWGKRSGQLTTFRHVGQCDGCGQWFMDDPPQPWHCTLEVQHTHRQQNLIDKWAKRVAERQPT